MAKEWESLPACATLEAMRRFLGECGEHADSVVRKISEDPGYVRQLAFHARHADFESSPAQKRAADIMGRGNMFGLAASIKYLGVCLTECLYDDLATIPFAESLLEECCDTHMLVAVLPRSIIWLRDKTRYGMFCRDDWRSIEACMEAGERAYWSLVRKTPVLGSGHRILNEQERLLEADDIIPSARELVWATVGHYLLTEERLFLHARVRCRDVADDVTSRAVVGPFDAIRGINIEYRSNLEEDTSLCLASAKRPASP